MASSAEEPALPATMRAVIFHGPKKVALEQRPVPRLQSATDALLRVRYTALCGSELHVYRGHQASGTGFIMGHEFTGTVVRIGTGVRRLKPGDVVVSPFTLSCGSCFYCARGNSSRCAQGLLFGSAQLDGGQAEYVRVPLADSTLVRAPASIEENKLVLMADIFPTGYFAAKNAFQCMATPAEIADAVVLLIGCGPVGLCALANARRYKPRALLAIDSVPARLALAQQLGAEPWNFATDRAGLDARVKALTDGRGADVAIEVVGLSPALRTAFDLLRPWGVISSVGVHNAQIPWTANEAYAKNLRLQMGRCPVRSVFEEALEHLAAVQAEFGFMADNVMPLDQAVEGYDLFDAMKVQKGMF